MNQATTQEVDIKTYKFHLESYCNSLSCGWLEMNRLLILRVYFKSIQIEE